MSVSKSSSNPKPVETDKCFACGQQDVRFGGLRRLEADHVAGEANNPDVLVWLCRRCHNVATGLQYDLGVKLNETDPRSDTDRYAALLQGVALRMAVMSAVQGSINGAARFLGLAASVGEVLHDRPDFNPESGVRSIGPNPLQNDIRHKRFASEGSDDPRTVVMEEQQVNAVAILDLINDVDSELPGGPFYTNLQADSVVEALELAGKLGLVARLEALAPRMHELTTLMFSGLSHEIRTGSEDIDPSVLAAAQIVGKTISETTRLVQALSDSDGSVLQVEKAFEVFFSQCEEPLQSVA